MNKLRKGDTIQVMRGKEAGKVGEIEDVVVRKDKRGYTKIGVIVKGLNMVKKAQKPNPQFGIQGGITEFEKPIDVSNVMFMDKKMNVPTRVGFKIDKKNGKRVRFSKKSGEVID